MQYVCSPGHGRRSPNGSLAEEFAVREATMGECVTWNCSRQMPHIGWRLETGYSEMAEMSQVKGGENERNVPGRGSSSSLALPLPFDHTSVFSEIVVIGVNTSEIPGLRVRLPLRYSLYPYHSRPAPMNDI